MSFEKSLEKQKGCLVSYIKEAEGREKDRLKRLVNVKSNAEHKHYLERFQKERLQEQRRIEHLTNDFFTLQKKFERGELELIQEERIHSGRKKEVDSEFQPNRFVGLEDRDGQVLNIIT
jgi:uncharacterized protein YwqG